jgi:hypothetical protein
MEKDKKKEIGLLNFNLVENNKSEWESLKIHLLGLCVVIMHPDKAKDILDLLNEVEQKKDKPIALLFVGDICAGKTTLINAILANLKLGDSPENLNKYKDYNLLKPSRFENTFFPTIIEYSKSLSLKERLNQLESMIYFDNSEEQGLKNIKKYFIEKDKKSTETMSMLKKSSLDKNKESTETTNASIGNEDEKIIIEKIYTFTHLGIPWIDKRIIMCDLPGVTISTIVDMISYFTKIEIISPIIIYVKSLDDPKPYDKEVLNLFEIFKKELGNVYIYTIFTKSDSLQDLVSEAGDCEKFVEQMKEFVNFISGEHLKCIGVDFINPKFILEKSPHLEQINGLNDCIKNLTISVLNNRDFILSDIITATLKKRIKEIFSKDVILTEKDILRLKELSKSKIKELDKFLEDYVIPFKNDISKFKEEKSDSYSFLNIEISNVKKMMNSKKFYNMTNLYLIELFNQLYNRFLNLIINKEFYNKIKTLTMNFYNEMSDIEKELVDKLTYSKEFEKHTDFIQKILFLYSITFDSSWLMNDPMKILLHDLIMSDSIFNYFLDFRNHDDNNEALIKNCLKKFVSNYPSIKKNILKLFSDVIEGIIDILEKQKLAIEESKELIKIIENYKIQDNFKNIDIKQVFREKVKKIENSILDFDTKEILLKCVD